MLTALASAIASVTLGIGLAFLLPLKSDIVSYFSERTER